MEDKNPEKINTEVEATEKTNIVDEPKEAPDTSKPYDRESRKYNITINNPQKYEFTHERIEKILIGFKGLLYFCMADEQGSCYHTHIYACFRSPVRFSTIKKRFQEAHIEACRGTSAQNREYIGKFGKWENDEKHGTKIEGTFFEYGDLPQENQGTRGDLSYLYEMVKNGHSNYEILEDNPEFMLRLLDIERTRQTIKAESYRNIFRLLEVTYIWGETGTGKTRSVMDKYGSGNVYRVTDYKHPFDAYKSEDIILFDEFVGNLRIQDMNNYLDGYSLDLPCRYANKQACYTKAYIISNIDLKRLYTGIQFNEPAVYAAFIRRINKVIRFYPYGTRREYDIKEYFSDMAASEKMPADMPMPFDNDDGVIENEYKQDEIERTSLADKE